MNIDQLRKICQGFPGVTEQIQWEDDLLFKVGGKMFAVTPLEPGYRGLRRRPIPKKFADLVERQGIIPAPYLARAKWISIETPETLSHTVVAQLLRKSYDLVVAKRLARPASHCLRVRAGRANPPRKNGRRRRNGVDRRENPQKMEGKTAEYVCS